MATHSGGAALSPVSPQVATGTFGRMANTAEGIEELADFCREAGAKLVVEASGGYEQAAFLDLLANNVFLFRIINKLKMARGSTRPYF